MRWLLILAISAASASDPVPSKGAAVSLDVAGPLSASWATFANLYGESVVYVWEGAKDRPVRLSTHGAVPMDVAWDGLVQAAAAAGVEARLVAGRIVVDKSSTAARPGVETHLWPAAPNRELVATALAAAGPNAVVTVGDGALIVTLEPAYVDAVSAAIGAR